MKQTTINFPRVIYRTDQLKKDGSYTFCIQIHLNGKKKQFTIPVSCKKEFYDDKTNRIKKSDPNSHIFNLLIEARYKKAHDIVLDALLKEESLTMEAFSAKYKGDEIDHSKSDFFAFVINEIELEKKKANKAIGTIRKYGFQLNKLQRFKSKLEFNDLTETFLADFEQHMREILGNDTGGSNNTLKFIRKFLYVAIKKGLTTNNPFKNYQIIEDKNGEIKFLTLEEFHKIKEYYKTLNPKHKHYLTLKSFIFCCCTGLRYGDGKRFKLSDINNNSILIKTQKTKKTVSVPIISQARELLNYDLDPNLPNLKTPCDQTCNRALKEVAIVCKINKSITTHYARHTFGCIALNNGMSRETVQAIYGHSTSKQTDHYAILNNDTKILEMAKLEGVF